MVVRWLFLRHVVLFLVQQIGVDFHSIFKLATFHTSYVSSPTMMVGADTGLVGLTLGAGQTGEVLLLLLLLMLFLIGIPVYLWFWRNYLKRVVAFYGGKVQVRVCCRRNASDLFVLAYRRSLSFFVINGLLMAPVGVVRTRINYLYIHPQEYINKAYERVSLRVSDAGRKISERVRT